MLPPKMLDNKGNGTVGDELKVNLQRGSKLSVISAYFTIYYNTSRHIIYMSEI
jgi:hypothetical protein